MREELGWRETGSIHSDVVGHDGGLSELEILEYIGLQDCPRF